MAVHGGAVKIVSVLNSKGGVGKTTLAANLGVAVAQRGRKVLLVDLDSQGSLTNCFYSPDGWQPEASDSPTIKRWFDYAAGDRGEMKLAEIVLFPPVVRSDVARKKGALGLLPANGALVDLEIALAAELGCKACSRGSPATFVEVHRRLEEGLRRGGLEEYDLVLIDCSPAFGILTRTAVVASDHVLVPTRPDYLSTYGISAFNHRLSELVSDYNKNLDLLDGRTARYRSARADVLGVVFTMAQIRGVGAISISDEPMRRVRALGLPLFKTMIRENKSVFGEASRSFRPAVLGDDRRRGPVRELRELSEEFIGRLWGGRRG